MKNIFHHRYFFIENKDERIKIKKGVDFVFEQNPELSQIGTKEEYSQYLETIFPESNIKEIVYHETSGDWFKNEKFSKYATICSSNINTDFVR